MHISELGEFPLIDRVDEIVGVERSDIAVGIGDDVAVLGDQGDELILATVDSQVEDVHFVRDRIAPWQLGRPIASKPKSRAAAVSLAPSQTSRGSCPVSSVGMNRPCRPPFTEHLKPSANRRRMPMT